MRFVEKATRGRVGCHEGYTPAERMLSCLMPILLIVGLIVVAVHAVVLVVVECAVVLINRRLLVGGEVTLIDAELAVELVARFNEAIGEVGVYRLIGDTEGEGSVAFPLSVAPRINCYLCRLAGICLKQGAPRGCVGLHETA